MMRSNEHAMTLLFEMAFCSIISAASAQANQILLEQPAPAHKFFDSPNFLLQSISAMMMAADIVTTKRALENPGTRELNSLEQPPAARYGLKFAAFGAGLG